MYKVLQLFHEGNLVIQ